MTKVIEHCACVVSTNQSTFNIRLKGSGFEPDKTLDVEVDMEGSDSPTEPNMKFQHALKTHSSPKGIIDCTLEIELLLRDGKVTGVRVDGVECSCN